MPAAPARPGRPRQAVGGDPLAGPKQALGQLARWARRRRGRAIGAAPPPASFGAPPDRDRARDVVDRDDLARRDFVRPGSATSLPSPMRWSCGGNENRVVRCDFFDGPRRRASSSPPSGSRSVDQLLVGHAAAARSSATRPTCPRAGARRAAGRAASGPRTSGVWARATGSPGSSTVSAPTARRPPRSRSVSASVAAPSSRPGRGSRPPSLRLEVAPPLLEPVAEAPVAHDVVAVVALDPGQDRPPRPRPASSAPSSSHVSNATMLLPASLSSTSRSSAYSGSIRLIE